MHRRSSFQALFIGWKGLSSYFSGGYKKVSVKCDVHGHCHEPGFIILEQVLIISQLNGNHLNSPDTSVIDFVIHEYNIELIVRLNEFAPIS
jgi:hypothetical protein